MNSMKKQKDMALKDELPRSLVAQCANGEDWRNNSRKNEEAEPKWSQHPIVDVIVMEVKSDVVRTILLRNLEFLIQGKLEIVKQELARVNMDILGIS